MANYEYHCVDCKTVTVANFEFSKRPDLIICEVPWCHGQAEYQISKPNLTKASYVDGNNRFQDLKEAAKLEKESAHAKGGSTKKEIAAEIRKMGVKKGSDLPW